MHTLMGTKYSLYRVVSRKDFGMFSDKCQRQFSDKLQRMQTEFLALKFLITHEKGLSYPKFALSQRFM